jgi:hypothetical protein
MLTINKLTLDIDPGPDSSGHALDALYFILTVDGLNLGEENWFLAFACIDPSVLPGSGLSTKRFWLERLILDVVNYIKALGISLESAAPVMQSLIDEKGSTGCNHLADLLEFGKRQPKNFRFMELALREAMVDDARQTSGKSFSIGDFLAIKRIYKRKDRDSWDDDRGSSGDDQRRGRSSTVSLDRLEWIADEHQSDN